MRGTRVRGAAWPSDPSPADRPATAGTSARSGSPPPGDIHLGRPADEERWTAAFGALRERVDVVLLAGDLTTHGEPEQAAMVARAVQVLDGVPVLAVLGNHDWHSNRRDEVAAALAEGGIDVLEREHRILEVCGAELGVAGAKGFAGGFDGAHIPDFGEPLLRAGLRRVDPRGGRARRGRCGRSRCARSASRCSTTRP